MNFQNLEFQNSDRNFKIPNSKNNNNNNNTSTIQSMVRSTSKSANT